MATKTSKTLFLSGTFDNPVSVNASFTFGDANCSATGQHSCAGGTGSDANGNNALAIGKTVVANGESAVALGESATAAHGNTFVWNGVPTVPVSSPSDGTFSINPKNGVNGFYISGRTIPDILGDNTIVGKDNIFTGKNRFTKMMMIDGGVSIGGGQVSALSGTKIDFTQTEFRIPTISVTEGDNSQNNTIGATVEYVRNKINNFLTMDNTWSGVQTFKQTINGVALKAKWADLAEYYEADREYTPGTLVQFGGDKEITIAKGVAHGVISTQPGLILGEKKHSRCLLVALCGRVPVKVIGKCNKFDKLYMSDMDGYACTIDNGLPPIGIALKDKSVTSDDTVMSIVKLSF